MKTRSFEIVSLALVAGTAAASWLIFGSHKMATGVLTGGVVGIANFNWLGRIVRNARQEKATGAAGYVFRYLFKLTIMAIIIAVLFRSRMVDPIAFITGFTLTVITVSVFGAELINRS